MFEFLSKHYVAFILIMKKFTFIGLFLLFCGLLFFFYSKPLLHPNQFLFSNQGDGIKNYYTYSYHIQNDSSLTAFEGMNYPYGEHFFYTDCHPVLTVLFRAVSSHNSFVATHSIAILNELLLLSIFLCFWICYLLLREFSIEKWLSVLFAAATTLLAPQIFRLSGHLALSYSLAIPLSWLLLLRASKLSSKCKYVLLLFINLLFWMFIHAYLGMIVIAFVFCTLLVTYIADSQRSLNRRAYIFNLLATLFPVIIFYAMAILTDHHVGRTNNPSGFFLYNAEVDDIFVPGYAPIRPFLESLTHGVIKQEWEAYSYVGFSSVILILVTIILAIKKLIYRKKPSLVDCFFENRTFNHSLIASAIVLLFALAIPFRQIPQLLDIFPILKQFRATGRFTWPFYFCALVFTAIAFNALCRRNATSNKARLILITAVAAALFSVYEGLEYQKTMSESIATAPNVFDKQQLSPNTQAAIAKIDSLKYQAIIALPFFYQGSESYSRPWNNQVLLQTITLSYHCKLPMVNADLTRTSIQESKNIVQLISPDFYPKQIVGDLPDSRPFLVVCTSKELTQYEADLLAKCDPVYESSELSVYSLSKEKLFHNSASERISAFKQLRNNLYPRNNVLLSKKDAFLYFNDFEHQKSDTVFSGSGGFSGKKHGKNTFAEFAPNSFDSSKRYHLSMWMYNGHQDALNMWFRFIVEEYSEAPNTWESTVFFPEQAETIFGDWSLIEGSFTIKNPQNRVYIVTKGKDDEPGNLFTDNLLITEEGTNVYEYDSTKNVLFYNNHIIRAIEQ